MIGVHKGCLIEKEVREIKPMMIANVSLEPTFFNNVLFYYRSTRLFSKIGAFLFHRICRCCRPQLRFTQAHMGLNNLLRINFFRGHVTIVPTVSPRHRKKYFITRLNWIEFFNTFSPSSLTFLPEPLHLLPSRVLPVVAGAEDDLVHHVADGVGQEGFEGVARGKEVWKFQWNYEIIKTNAWYSK